MQLIQKKGFQKTIKYPFEPTSPIRQYGGSILVLKFLYRSILINGSVYIILAEKRSTGCLWQVHLLYIHKSGKISELKISPYRQRVRKGGLKGLETRISKGLSSKGVSKSFDYFAFILNPAFKTTESEKNLT